MVVRSVTSDPRSGEEGCAPRRRAGRGAAWSVLWMLSGIASLAAAEPMTAAPEPRPVGAMHEALAAVNEIIGGVAREDYPLILERSRELRSIAQRLKALDLEVVGLDPAADADFDRYLEAQRRAAKAISRAAQDEDLSGVLAGIQRIFDQACVPCHRDFRQRYPARTSSVLIMRNLLNSTTMISWGLIMDDYTVIAREARSVEIMAQIVGLPAVASALFEIAGTHDQNEFRAFVVKLVDHANRVEGAAFTRDPATITASVRRMLDEGCVPCHARFRQVHRPTK